MKETRKQSVNISASENKIVQRKLDEANAALKRVKASIFERKVTPNHTNER